MDFVKNFTVTKEANSQIKIEGEIPFEELQKHREKAIKHLGKNIEIKGFRKGNIPEKVIVEKVGDMAVLSEMAERALALAYPEALKHHKVDAIGYPQISITKIAQDNPLGFTVVVATIPEVTLSDYKKIAKEQNKDKASTEVTEEDVEKQIADVLRQKVAYEKIQENAKAKSEKNKQSENSAESTDLPTPETVEKKDESEKETHTHADGTVHEGPAHDEEKPIEKIEDLKLPELTDELVATLGQPGQFKTVDDFKAKIKEHLTIEKEREVNAAHRAKITDAIIATSEIDLPQILIDSEIEQMFAQMNEDLTRANLKMEDYLKHIKKTKEDLKKEWSPAAEKRARLQLVLNEIAKKENIKPDQTQVDQQVDQLLEQHKDADEARVRVYVTSVMTNEAVMKMLEAQK